MKERPILFSGPMVRAILDGRKTQTRRAVKPQPDVPVTDAIPRRNYPHGPATIDWYWRPQHGHRQSAPSAGWDFKCPYGQPGDRLWVRETIERMAAGNRSMYAADGTFTVAETWPWKRNTLPSIHCPRGLSRILLEIVSVRVERLQEISESDAQAEGVNGEQEAAAAGLSWHDKPRRAFRFLWQSINGSDSWDANRWVWVVEFTRVDAATVN